MAAFQFGVPAGFASDSYIAAALGVAAGTKLTDLDIGKAVKLIADSNYGLVADGNDIEGVLVSVEPVTVNDGLGFGTVQVKERVVAISAGAGALTLGAYVVAAAQQAVGTAVTAVSSGPHTGVKGPNVKAGAGVLFKWRVVSLLSGAGAVGTPVLIEKI